MTSRFAYQFCVSGKHSFENVETFDVEALTKPQVVYVYEGETWYRCKSLQAANQVIRHIHESRYDCSSRATPTGFGLIANSKREVFAYSYANRIEVARCIHIVKLENGEKDYTKFTYVESDKMTIGKLALTKRKQLADKRAMYRAIGE